MEAGLQVTVLGRFSRIYRLVASVSDLSCSGGTAPVSYQCYALHTRYCWPDLDNFKFEASSQDEGNDSTKGTASAPMQNPLLKLRLRVLCDFNRLQAPKDRLSPLSQMLTPIWSVSAPAVSAPRRTLQDHAPERSINSSRSSSSSSSCY